MAPAGARGSGRRYSEPRGTGADTRLHDPAVTCLVSSCDGELTPSATPLITATSPVEPSPSLTIASERQGLLFWCPLSRFANGGARSLSQDPTAAKRATGMRHGDSSRHRDNDSEAGPGVSTPAAGWSPGWPPGGADNRGHIRGEPSGWPRAGRDPGDGWNPQPSCFPLGPQRPQPTWLLRPDPQRPRWPLPCPTSVRGSPAPSGRAQLLLGLAVPSLGPVGRPTSSGGLTTLSHGPQSLS